MTPLAGPWPLRDDSRRGRFSLPWDESLGGPPLGAVPLGAPLAEPCSLLSSTGTSSTPLPCEVVLRSPNRRGGGMSYLESMRKTVSMHAISGSSTEPCMRCPLYAAAVRYI